MSAPTAATMAECMSDFVGTKGILGRDVLNRLEILFRGPASEVVFNL
jgi:hypothetical protein